MYKYRGYAIIYGMYGLVCLLAYIELCQQAAIISNFHIDSFTIYIFQTVKYKNPFSLHIPNVRLYAWFGSTKS